jgi:hypothetical protein
LSTQPKYLAYPVVIGNSVTWFEKANRWRIDVVEPAAMTAVYILHDTLTKIVGEDSHDPAVIAGLVQVHRSSIEELISDAEMEQWPDRLGILPHGIDGFYKR